MVNTNDQSNSLCIMYAMFFVDTVDMKIKAHNALNSVCYVVCRHCQHKDTSVCGSYTTLYTGVKTLYTVASHPSKREGYLKSLPSCGLSCSPV